MDSFVSTLSTSGLNWQPKSSQRDLNSQPTAYKSYATNYTMRAKIPKLRGSSSGSILYWTLLYFP